MLAVLLGTFFARGQDSSVLRISLLTCGVGEELYSSYGHSAVRVTDTLNGTDLVYNYGSFNFGDPDFYMKFTRGKLPYYLNAETMDSFMSLYVEEGRSVAEQILQLNKADALPVQAFLKDNLKEENRYYKYDFLFDNCSTRIRDLFATIFKNRINLLPVASNDSMTFRTILNHYERHVHWERFGINLLMSNLVDQKMKSYESMFLPDYLMRGFDVASLDGHKLSGVAKVILPAGHLITTKMNKPLVCMAVACSYSALVFSQKNEHPAALF